MTWSSIITLSYGPIFQNIVPFSSAVLVILHFLQSTCFDSHLSGDFFFLSWLWDKQWGSLCQNQLEANAVLFRKCPRCWLVQCSVIKPQQEWLVNCNPWTLEQQPHCGELSRATPSYPLPHPSENKLVQAACHVSSGSAAHLSVERAAEQSELIVVFSASWQTEKVCYITIIVIIQLSSSACHPCGGFSLKIFS